MSPGVEFSGFDEISNKLEELINKGEEMEGSNEVPAGELFSEQFMGTYTEFGDFDELLEESEFEVEDEEDFKNIPDKDWDEFINANTQFDDWEEMVSKGTESWVGRQLDL